jgi:pimeloyl-ACP methyl ester carboxylesterase
MAVNTPLFYDSINARLRNSSVTDLINWLGSKTPEASAALADASKVDPQAISDSISSFQSNSLFGKMRQTQIPCLLVHGQSDPAIPSPPADTTINLPHMMHHIVLDSSGHFPMLDEPARFNRLMTDFMALESGVSPRELQVKEEWKRRVR